MITYHFQNDEETFDAMTELTLRVNPTKRAMVAQQEKIKSAYADAGVISWEKDYQGKEIPNTGSFGWKMVFEYKDGTFFACEGFTGDGSHLPDKFDSVDKVLLEIANCD